jgi:hypothetical protein
MNRLFFALVLGLMMVPMTTSASYKRYPLNAKFPSQDVLEHQTVTPVTADADRLLNDNAGATAAAAKTVTVFLAQPDVARNITLTPGGTTGDIEAGTVVVTGINAKGQVISENFTLIENHSLPLTGSKAFLSVSSIQFPAESGTFAATWDVGVGDTLGFSKCLGGAGYVLAGLVDGADLTGMTLATSATALESNTVVPNPAANGTRQFDFLFVQNFRCD